MIQKEQIYQFVEAFIADTENFIVDVKVNPENNIVVEIDSEKGIDIEYCAELSRFIESQLDREIEDYELEVGSAGLGSPFKVLKQYQKNIGNEVEVLTKGGKKFSAILKNAAEDAFTVTVTKQVKPEGAKRKITVEEDEVYSYNEVKYTKYLIRFK
ncbi:ribosome assembly cofactor RimP [Paludibacter jiangxiensis]|uniref:Ribosome maturation factor RimP n=1 Tax=Paludibacter jiangxiensis TaxID=681398 RepID=A0A161LCR9_9BACT|nr:ribosome assembly cofactor RimP [Paludibacter jiangxiensis]GAT61507.1 ribosome maturation factor RimP [Paludibacter jiangxiensis]